MPVRHARLLEWLAATTAQMLSMRESRHFLPTLDGNTLRAHIRGTKASSWLTRILLLGTLVMAAVAQGAVGPQWEMYTHKTASRMTSALTLRMLVEDQGETENSHK